MGVVMLWFAKVIGLFWLGLVLFYGGFALLYGGTCKLAELVPAVLKRIRPPRKST